MKVFIFLTCFAFNQLSAQDFKINFIHLENDYDQSINFLTGIQSYYNLHITKETALIVIANQTQFNVQEFVNNVEDTITSEKLLYIFMTDKPIYIGEPSLNLRGFASKYVCIISTYKIKTESNTETEYEFLVLKTGLHELGHLLGLQHCEYSSSCLMVSSLPNPSNFINSHNKLCDKCSNQVRKYLK